MRQFLRWIPVVAATSAAAFAFACSSSSSGGDDPGGAAGSGGSKADAGACGVVPTSGPENCFGTLPVMQVWKDDGTGTKVASAPDWSCAGGAAGSGGAGGADAGAGGDDAGDDAGSDGGPPASSNLFDLQAFGSNNSPMANVTVDLFFGNTVIDQTPDFTGVTAPAAGGPDGAAVGQFWFPHPSQKQIAYKVQPKPSITKGLIEFDIDVPAVPGKLGGNGMAPALFDQLATFAVPLPGWTPPPELGIVVAPARDCAGRDLQGAQGEIYDVDAQQAVTPCNGAKDPHYVYFSGDYPNTSCQFTDHQQALFVVINAPTNTEATKGHKYSLRLKGRMTEADTEAKVFAERPIEVFADSINVFHLSPK